MLYGLFKNLALPFALVRLACDLFKHCFKVLVRVYLLIAEVDFPSLFVFKPLAQTIDTPKRDRFNCCPMAH